ncbi:tRNA (adenosine(37)-N6)-threonylcarbamoyltransferase complex dimerization subunit type 1 TsaB [Fonticella tunisiensis]|uniref:tRNA threonylcarbamoyl adenosine modification protein YeaZ n=1 Tax=Fonticella tunisiensis TaxID=1096341 RepID=A0A4R7KV94_9CLOT|nr:tRNA (adenosine(37)-N6)-threonylcarbamoyltransferase complex dimerization subunit type 1 TsaB [Fonticella tunisiensis]TDT62437.1 tRNA threonylcarbamoyl adenosine modification protein YeaZ [Fonticella tunisiensis]
MRILAIDTSGSAATAAVLSDEKLEAEVFLNHKLQHSTILFPMIEDLLKMLELNINDIDAVAVSGGPGSFTGLRIGVAAAKGIAQGGNMKFIGISSLDAMAFQQVGFDGIICPIMDALRDNVYTSLYSWQNDELFKVHDYDALHIDDLISRLMERSERVMFCGDGVKLHRDRLIEALKDRAAFAPLSTNMPRASSLAELALLRLKKGEEDSIFTYGPIYIRKSQAEREYERKQGVRVE